MIESASTLHYSKLNDILGRNYITDTIYNSFDFILIAKKGINANVIKNFRTHFGLTLESTATMLNTSEPTIYRWTKTNKSLKKNISIKLLEIADLFLYGSEVFESKENFNKWLNIPNIALGGMLPLALIEIPGGISKITDILGRIEHGVYS